MSKIGNIILIVILSVIAVSLVGILVLGINNNFRFNDIVIEDSYSNNLLEEKEIEEIKDLDIHAKNADIKVEEYDENTIKVEIYSNNEKEYDITEESNKVKVLLEDKSAFNFGFVRKVGLIKVYVPKDYSNEIKTNSKTGDIKIGKLQYATLNSTSTVGDIKVEKITKANINSDVGDVKVGTAQELIITDNTGDIKVENVEIINAKVTTGDIKITKVTDSLKLESKTGDIKIGTADLKSDSKITSNVGDVKINKTTGCYVEGKSSVGDMDINNNNRKSDIILSITSNIGDIEVND